MPELSLDPCSTRGTHNIAMSLMPHLSKPHAHSQGQYGSVAHENGFLKCITHLKASKNSGEQFVCISGSYRATRVKH